MKEWYTSNRQIVLNLFNIFVNDLFFFSAKCEFCYFSDDNSLHSCGMSLDYIFTNLTQNMLNVYEWLLYNSMKANPDKLQFMILGNTESHILQIGDITTKSVWSLTLLGITIDSKLNLKNISTILQKKHIINYMP